MKTPFGSVSMAHTSFIRSWCVGAVSPLTSVALDIGTFTA